MSITILPAVPKSWKQNIPAERGRVSVFAPLLEKMTTAKKGAEFTVSPATLWAEGDITAQRKWRVTLRAALYRKLSPLGISFSITLYDQGAVVRHEGITKS